MSDQAQTLAVLQSYLDNHEGVANAIDKALAPLFEDPECSLTEADLDNVRIYFNVKANKPEHRQLETGEVLPNGGVIQAGNLLPNGAEVIEAKVNDQNEVVYLAKWHENEWATWEAMAGVNDCYWGHYYNSLAAAMQGFNLRGRA